MRTFSTHLRLGAACVAALIFTLLAPAAARAVTLLGLTDSNRLVLFDSAEPGKVLGSVEVTGLQPDEVLLGIDTHEGPTSQLYAVGSTSRIYTLNPGTGVATQVGSGPFSPALNIDAAHGFEVGMTFERSGGRIRVVSNGQSLRINSNNGAVVAVDQPLFSFFPGPAGGPVPSVSGIAQEFGGGQPTTLYGIEWKTNRLLTIGSRGGQPVSPNTGEVFPVGPLFVASGSPDPSVTLNDKVGFDIASLGFGYASLTRAGAPSSALHLVDLKTGEAHEVGPVGTGGAGVFLRSLVVLPDGSHLYALTAGNRLLLINTYMPGAVMRSKAVTGLQPGESLLALDTRRNDGYLYSVGGTGRLYRIAAATGAATQVGPDPISPPLEGTEFSLARDTIRDRIRLVSDADKSWFFEFPSAGGGDPSVSPAAALRYAPGDRNAGQNPRVVGLAWGKFGSPNGLIHGSRYYGIDADRDALVYEEDTDLGTLRTLGPLGFDAGDFVGFENPLDSFIGSPAYASLTLPCPGGCAAPSTLFKMNLDTGQATPVGGIGGGEAVRDIVAAPPAPTVHFSKAAQRVTEDCTGVTLLVIRTGSLAAVDFTTGDGGAGGAPSADGRSDYNAASGRLRFATGEVLKPLRILINEDSHPEKEDGHEGEAFTVKLGVPHDPNRVVGFSSESLDMTTVLIVDDEDGGGGQGNPIDESRNFVCQHYHDFLNRDPDEDGWDFWADTIGSCGSDEQCHESRRFEVSAAFFLSIEFQETRYLVYRMHKAAFGDIPEAPVPVRLADFLRDSWEIGQGVVVGPDGWRQKMEENKRAFSAEFVSRPRFAVAYPQSMTPEVFVDALNANAGGALSQSERDALVSDLKNGVKTRAQALRAVAEDPDMQQKEFNRAFVLMQYFGYLRRDPDSGPDTDFGGYNFWLGKLNEFGGDFRRAEMVRAFVEATEYRKRFGQ